MNNEYIKIQAPMDSRVTLRVMDGHFATSHSHVTKYLGITAMKSRCNEAHAVANLLAMRYSMDTPVDTIVCLDGTQVIGTFLAEELTKAGILSYNAHRTLYVIQPEFASDQIIFRDNIRMALHDKYVLCLMGSITTGRTVRALMESLTFYQAKISGISAVFSAIKEVDDIPIHAAFHAEDIPGYESYAPHDCPLCREGKKIDALVNSYGYALL